MVHWATYALWPIALAHSIGNGTDSGRVWFLAFAGVCVLIVAAALVWRLRSNFTEYTDLEIFERTWRQHRRFPACSPLTAPGWPTISGATDPYPKWLGRN